MNDSPSSKTLLKHGDMEVEDMEGFVEIHDAGESVMLKNAEAVALRDWLCQRFPRECDHGVSLSQPCERCRHPDEPKARYHCTICGGDVDLSAATKPTGLPMAGRTRVVTPPQVNCTKCGDTGRQWDNGDMIECDHV